MLKAHASVMIKPLGGNPVKIMERRKYARQLDFKTGDMANSGNLIFRAFVGI